MNHIIFILAGAFVIHTTALFAQYPGELVTVKPIDEINSDFEESKPILNNSGDTLYFVRSYHPENQGGINAGSDIWVSINHQGKWSKPENLDDLNTKESDQVIGISTDGSILYTLKYHVNSGRRYGLIMKSLKSGTKWESAQPTSIPPILLVEGYNEFYMHPSGRILLISMRGIDSIGEEDLYIVLNKAEQGWIKPLHMGSVLNTAGFEISPYLSKDSEYLFFASNGLNGFGDSDIYMSERLDESYLNWSTPKNLGGHINSESFDAFYFTNNQGAIYFTSNRSNVNADIYTSVDNTPGLNKGKSILPSPSFAKENTRAAESFKLVLFFELDKETAAASDLEKLEKMSTSLSDSLVSFIKIRGYTDNSGGWNYNHMLSQRRANSIALFLSQHFDKEVSIESIGLGIFTESNVPELMRRVEIQFILDQN